MQIGLLEAASDQQINQLFAIHIWHDQCAILRGSSWRWICHWGWSKSQVFDSIYFFCQIGLVFPCINIIPYYSILFHILPYYSILLRYLSPEFRNASFFAKPMSSVRTARWSPNLNARSTAFLLRWELRLLRIPSKIHTKFVKLPWLPKLELKVHLVDLVDLDPRIPSATQVSARCSWPPMHLERFSKKHNKDCTKALQLLKLQSTGLGISQCFRALADMRTGTNNTSAWTFDEEVPGSLTLFGKHSDGSSGAIGWSSSWA